MSQANLYKSPRTIERETREGLQRTSDRLFASGLRFASDGDYTHADEYLRKAIRYDKFNIRARNLLGLIQFQQGEIGEAIREWRLSLQVRADKNRAAYYLTELGKERQLIANMGQSLILFNEALKLAAEDQGDFALVRLKKACQLNPRYVKAHLLLAVCYMGKEAYSAAAEVLERAKAVDPFHPDLLRYEKFIKEALAEGAEDATPKEIRDRSEDEEVLRSLNNPDLDDYAGEMEKSDRIRDRRLIISQFLLFIAGLVLGGLFIGYLWMPQKLSDLTRELSETRLQVASLEQDKEILEEKVESAAGVLQVISEGGTSVSETVLADVRQVLRQLIPDEN